MNPDWEDVFAFCTAHRCHFLRLRGGRWSPFFGSDPPCVGDFIDPDVFGTENYRVVREVVCGGVHAVYRIYGCGDLSSTIAERCGVCVYEPYGGM